MQYKIGSRRYALSGLPISVTHSIFVDTEREGYLHGVGADQEKLRIKFESFWNAPQDDGSRIRVDSIEAVLKE